MKLTQRQHFLLENLHKITSRMKTSGRSGFFLAQEDCTTTINSLIVKRVLTRTNDGHRVRVTNAADLVRPEMPPAQ